MTLPGNRQALDVNIAGDERVPTGTNTVKLLEADEAWITRRIMDVAQRHRGGRIVSCLEGGHALSTLARSVAAHPRVLAVA
jgi:acetoin utilization deacetylase AcuC-like enzyme